MTRLLTCIALLFALFSCNQMPESLYEWRGENRNGIYSVDHLLNEWPENGPELMWSVDFLGDGFGSPTCVEDEMWVVGTQDSTSYLYNITVDGVLVDRYELGHEWIVNFPGSRCAPTVLGDRIYAMTGQGDVACFNRKSNSMEWKINMVDDFQGVIPRFGYSQSLVVHDDKVFCCPGGEEYNVVALNRLSGELVWSNRAKGERPAYNPARLIVVNGRSIFVTFSAYHLMGFDAASGEMLWSHEQINTPVDKRQPGRGDTHANTILFDNNTIYYVEGDGNCAIALKVSDDGSSIEQIWNNATVDNYMGGIVLTDGSIYSCGYSKKTLVKMDMQSGVVLDSLKLGRGSLIAVNSKLIFYNEKGEVCLVDRSSDKMTEISKFKITEGSKQHFAHPVVHHDLLLVRRGEFLGAYKIAK